MKDYNLKLSAPAKVNYYLKINGLRKDGYHDIITVFQTVSLYDYIYFTELPRKTEISTDNEELNNSGNNLVEKAASMLKRAKKVEKGARIFIKKNIPMGAGLGGGSSDAAYALKGLANLWNLKLSDNELMQIASRLGADVSFFIKGGIAMGKGKGDVVHQIGGAMKPHLHILLVQPPFKISTAEAYKLWDEKSGRSGSPGSDHFMNALSSRSFTKLTGNLYNDFEPVMIDKHPVIGEIKQALLDNGAAGALMTGSGSVVFGIFRNEEKIDEIRSNFEKFGETTKVFTI